MTPQDEEHIDMIDDCENRDQHMTEWERGFCESIRERLEGDKPLSAKQIETLENIWERCTSRG